MAIYKYGLISDTHGTLHMKIFDIFQGVETIFHAGDVVGNKVWTACRNCSGSRSGWKLR